MRRRTLLPLLFSMLLTACGAHIGVSGGGTATPFIITATLEPTAVPSVTLTPMPPTPSPTTVPVQGTTSTQVNVRGQPSTSATSIHMLPPFVTVQVVGSDPDVAWYEIIDPDAPGGLGWVSAQFIIVPQNKDKIPVIGGTATATPATGTAAPGTQGASATGTVIQQVNVRKGPGTSFDPIGTLNPNDTVTLIGKDPTGDWYQVVFGAGPGGKGWVAAGFIQASDTEKLPVVGSAGKVIGTGTPVAVALVATSAPSPAYDDQDSAQSPGTTVALSSSGTQALIYSSDLSSPEGDRQDWAAFTSDGPSVLASLACTGNSSVSIQLTQDGSDVPNLDGLGCGNAKQASISAGKPYLVELSVRGGGAGLNYVRYTLEIRVIP